jgi:hypothetical protein
MIAFFRKSVTVGRVVDNRHNRNLNFSDSSTGNGIFGGNAFGIPRSSVLWIKVRLGIEHGKLGAQSIRWRPEFLAGDPWIPSLLQRTGSLARMAYEKEAG